MRNLVLPLLVVALGGCASSMPEGMRLIPQHEEAPGGCKERTRVEARSENSWWQGLVTPVSHESKARERLLRRARKAGADTVYITAHRAYRGEHRGEGIVRVELEGRALDCSGV